VSLRTALLALSALIALVGAAQLVAGRGASGAELLGLGVLGILGTAFERWRYRKRPPPAARWEPTGERFEDPATGEVMEVLYDPVSGERRYEPVSRHSA
jgi:hypothetical protein